MQTSPPMLQASQPVSQLPSQPLSQLSSHPAWSRRWLSASSTLTGSPSSGNTKASARAPKSNETTKREALKIRGCMRLGITQSVARPADITRGKNRVGVCSSHDARSPSVPWMMAEYESLGPDDATLCSASLGPRLIIRDSLSAYGVRSGLPESWSADVWSSMAARMPSRSLRHAITHAITRKALRSPLGSATSAMPRRARLTRRGIQEIRKQLVWQRSLFC